MCPFLSALFIILEGLTMTWFGEKMLIFTRCIHGFMSKLIKKSWTDSSAYVEHRAIGSRRAPSRRLCHAWRRAAPRLSVAVRGLTRLSGPNEIDSFQSWRHCQDFMLGAPPKQMRPIFTVVDIRELGVTARIRFKFYSGNHLKPILDTLIEIFWRICTS